MLTNRLTSHSTLPTLQKLLILTLLALLMYGCAKGPVQPDRSPQEMRKIQAEEAMQAGDYARAHALYERLANEHRPPETWGYQLLAIQALYQAGRLNLANQRLAEMPLSQLPPESRFEHQLLQGQVNLQRDPDLTLSMLLHPAVPEQLLPHRGDLYARYHQLRAEAFARLANPLESAREYILREMYLSDDALIEENQHAIWQALALLPARTLHEQRVQPPPDVLSGWMELAELARNYRLTPSELSAHIAQWLQRYPGHPATATFLDSLLQRSSELTTRPAEVALLLPLSGRFAAPGRAIQDGILAAWYADPLRDETRLRIHDVGDNPAEFMRHYQAALSAGAEFIIGPLDKASVERLSMHDDLPVPVLALNHAGPALDDQLYQFGLSPEDEAREVARRAWQSGHRNAAMLLPNSPLGERLGRAFAADWQALGGQILSERQYEPGHNDFAAPIKALFNISDSELRYRRINLFSRLRVEFTPRLRQDIDFIFLAAQPRQARLIRPQLRFHHAGEVPVYSTSHLYSGTVDRDADRDMDGILFCDMPWTLNADTVTRAMREQDRTLLNEHGGQLQRFVAMGVDAYQLLPLLGMLKSHPHESYAGETGRIGVNENGLVTRHLEWARFQRGTPQLLIEELRDASHVQTLTQ